MVRLMKDLEAQMKVAAKNLEFEKAAFSATKSWTSANLA